MAELFGSSRSSLKKNPFEDLAVVYVMYFDEAQGHMPLLIYPVDQYRNNIAFMRPIKYHPIWFLSLDESDALDHIDLEFKGYTFFGKKFLTQSKREKRRAGLEEETPETIVVILSLPEKIELFGVELIRLLTQGVQDKYGDTRQNAMEALVKIGSDAVDPLLNLLNKRNKTLRTIIAQILGDIGDPRAIEALSQMKRSASDFKMRRSAARALKKIKNKHL